MPLALGSSSLSSVFLGATAIGAIYRGETLVWQGSLPEPALDFDLTTALDSSITFSRPSLATMFDATGALTFAPNNLITWSQGFGNSAWAPEVSGVKVPDQLDANGGLTAVRFEATSNGVNQLSNSQSSHGEGTYIFSCDVNPSNTTWCYIQINTANIDADAQFFNLATMAVGSKVTLAGSSNLSNPTITARPDGYFRVSVRVRAGSTTSQVRPYIGPCDTDSARDCTAGKHMLIAFADLQRVTYETTPRAYNPTDSAAYYGPRFDYDPITLQGRGLLVEGTATNLLLGSLSDGTNLATQSVAVSAVPYTLSFYGTGTVTLSGASSAGPLVGSSAFPARSTLTFTPSAGTLTLTVSGSVQYAQLETGTVATSYIPTAIAQATRAADAPVMTGTSLSDWYNQTEGTFIAEFSGPAVGDRTVMAVDDDTSSEMMRLRTEGINPFFRVVDGGVEQAAIDAGTVGASTYYKFAAAYKASNFASAIAGGAAVTDTSGTLPTVNRLRIGVDQSGAALNGHVRRLTYYNKRLTNAQLSDITAP